jgi:hypothetical protein
VRVCIWTALPLADHARVLGVSGYLPARCHLSRARAYLVSDPPVDIAGDLVTSDLGAVQERKNRDFSRFFEGGAGGGTRTPTPLRETDFESIASAISPHRQEDVVNARVIWATRVDHASGETKPLLPLLVDAFLQILLMPSKSR